MTDSNASAIAEKAEEKNWQLILLWFGIAAVAFALDQVTKAAIVDRFVYDQIYTVTSFFDLTLRHNHGAAFSFLADQGGWQRIFFTVIAGGVSIVLVVWLIKSGAQKAKWMENLALALILSGALGNLYDRVTLGYVIDFLVFHYQNKYAWPAFNVADAAICAGAGLMLLEMFRGAKKNDT